MTFQTHRDRARARLNHQLLTATGRDLADALEDYEQTGDHDHGRGPIAPGEPCPGGDCLVAKARAALALATGKAELRQTLERTLPLLCKLGDFIGNGPGADGTLDAYGNLGERCETILAVKRAIALLDGEVRS